MGEIEQQLLDKWSERHKLSPLLNLTLSWVLCIFFTGFMFSLVWIYGAILRIDSITFMLRLTMTTHVLLLIMFIYFIGVKPYIQNAFEQTVIFYLKKKEGTI